MAIVKTDSVELSRELNQLLNHLESGGAYIHPKMIISNENGNLSVKVEGESTSTLDTLIKVPQSMLIRTESIDISLKKGNFSFVGNQADSLSANQQVACEHMFSIYNLSNKAESFAKESFWLSLQPYPNVLNNLLSLRFIGAPLEANREKMKGVLDNKERDSFICESFFKTRVLGVNDHNLEFVEKELDDGQNTESSKNSQVIMPVVDFINHHWLGSSFSFANKKSASELVVSSRRPVLDSNECFVFYSPMDALDSFIKYSFVDLAAPVVRTVPITLIIKDKITIEILGVMASATSKKLANPLRNLKQYFPTVIGFKERVQLKLTHLFIPDERAPRSMRRILAFYIRQLVGPQASVNEIKNWVKIAELQILAENISAYQSLASQVKAETEAQGESDVLKNVLNLALSQINKIEQYQLLISKLDANQE